MFSSYLTQALFACLCIFSLTSGLRAQGTTNTNGPLGQNWPGNPPVGIGTVPDGTPLNALQIHYDPVRTLTMPAMLRLSEGDSTDIPVFGLLGLMPAGTTTYSSLSRNDDLILHEHSRGDLILTNFNTGGWGPPGAIRLATTPVDSTLPLPGPFVPLPNTDLECETILSNGNVGFDLPPDSATELGIPRDQVQIGGGMVPPPGYSSAIPGLTIYGGSRFEGLPTTSDMYPFDWRYLGFNYGINHADSSSARSFRLARMSSSKIAFAQGDGASVTLECDPYDSTRGTNDFRRALTFHMMGTKGIEVWKDVSDSDVYHHLYDCWVPGFPGYNWQVGGDSLRNVNGLFIHHTPVLITGATDDQHVLNFTNFANVHPSMGDGKTFMLAVEGPVLAKEIFVLDTVWSDFVFQPGYHLPTLGEVEAYTKANHHLPGIPSAGQIKDSGISLGATAAKLLQKIEELTEYAIEQNKKIESLENKVTELQLKQGR